MLQQSKAECTERTQQDLVRTYNISLFKVQIFTKEKSLEIG